MSPRSHRLATYAAVLAASLASLATSSSEGGLPDSPPPLPAEPALRGPGPGVLDEGAPRAERTLRFKLPSGSPEFEIVTYFQAERLDALKVSAETLEGQPLVAGSSSGSAPEAEAPERHMTLSRRWRLSPEQRDEYCPPIQDGVEEGSCAFDARVVFERVPAASGDEPGPVLVDRWEVHLNAQSPEVEPPSVELVP